MHNDSAQPKQRIPQIAKSVAIECPCSGHSPIIIEQPLPLSTQPTLGNMHCPLCSYHPTSLMPTDVWHIQAVTADLPYKAVKLGLNLLREHLEKHPNRRHFEPSDKQLEKGLAPIHVPSPVEDITAYENYIMLEGPMAHELQASAAAQGVCYVHAHCTTCATSFTITRNTYSDDDTPDGNAVEPHPCRYQYCPFCGSATITITPTSTEETAWNVLAEHYNIPVPALQVLYDMWQTNAAFNNSHTFASFLNSFAQKAQDEVNAMREQVKA